MKTTFWQKRAACLWWVISGACVTAASAQNEQQTFAYANQLYAQQRFEDAAFAYQRLAFFSNTDSILFTAYSRVADYWQGLDSLDRANAYLQYAYNTAAREEDKNAFALQRTENFIVEKKYLEALEELLSINSTNPQTLRQAQLDEAVIDFGLAKYDASEKLFVAYADSARHPEQAARIHKLFKRNARVSHVNPKTAMVLSMIVPGTGQMYAGDFRNGINSLLLTSFFGFVFVNTVINNGIVDGVASVLPWYYRYYQGGYKRAEVIAKEQIAKRRAALYRELMLGLN